MSLAKTHKGIVIKHLFELHSVGESWLRASLLDEVKDLVRGCSIAVYVTIM